MVTTRPTDAFGRPISEQTEKVITQETPEAEESPLDLYRTFQIQRELRNASSFARKALSRLHPAQYLELIEKRLKKRGLSAVSIETALLSVKKSLRR